VKKHIRVLGIDDAPFRFEGEKVLVVGVVMRLPGYLEGVMRTECSVDGDDANSSLEQMISRSRFREQFKLVMLDGVALGGFNVIDIDRLHERTGIPVATVTRDHPDMDRIEDALRKYFDDWRTRLELIRRHPLHEVPTDHKPLFVSIVGISLPEAQQIISQSIVRGAYPEPLRMAHIIASGMVKGESRGRA